ncbi:hypothetical protein EW145_g6981 [Phellinidium pouzarii]|uniref:Pterin-binding domain-containing protein n=1 Tax=Phellinidium pouzarii TaxID=167371 RepID=A0A4S4KR35_9AGAM|nr:hypothetical protein EW145_g6981 [Phellinidium pouzarii]
MDDHIKVHGLSLTAPLSESPWTTIDTSQKPVLQPIVISLDIHLDINAAGLSDDLTQSISYSDVCKSAQRACINEPSALAAAATAYGLTEGIIEQCLAGIHLQISQLDVELELPKATLRAKNFLIRDLPLHTIIGIHPHERHEKQPVIVNIELFHAKDLDRSFKFNFARLERYLSDFVEASSYLTVEALASEAAKECFAWLPDPELYTMTLSVAKPAALRLADAPEISITRAFSDFHSLDAESHSESATNMIFAALALGSNLGDRFQNIELALRYLENFQTLSVANIPAGQIHVIDTSFLYETAPMYVVSQPSFINCACLVETSLSAFDLLRVCKMIEEVVGRVPSVRFGPRAIDLDIITYGDRTVDTRIRSERASLDNLEGQVVVPHPRMTEREFVLRPLKDIIPEWVHPQLNLSIRSLLAKLLLAKPAEESPMRKVMPFPDTPSSRKSSAHDIPTTKAYWVLPERHIPGHINKLFSNRTYVMATLNVTPDSFSDRHSTLLSALSYAENAVEQGADIIDVGGYSTRPGAAFVSPAEEIERVVPAVRAIRSSDDKSLSDVLISVDTFRAEVARAAIEAGANCINDVYAFSGPGYPVTEDSEEHFNEMRNLVVELGVPVIMMHSRGDAGSNKDYSMYVRLSGKPVLEGVRAELGEKVERATKGKGGLRRWKIMVDPGIGFSKSVEGNLELLRNASLLTVDAALPPLTNISKPAGRLLPYVTPRWNPLAGYPVLIGTSRKSFLGTIIMRTQPGGQTILPRSAENRDFATAAAVTCAVQQGAAMVRVHEVEGMVDVAMVASALWS